MPDPVYPVGYGGRTSRGLRERARQLREALRNRGQYQRSTEESVGGAPITGNVSTTRELEQAREALRRQLRLFSNR
jgi:hypothetical protein